MCIWAGKAICKFSEALRSWRRGKSANKPTMTMSDLIKVDDAVVIRKMEGYLIFILGYIWKRIGGHGNDDGRKI